MMRLYITLICLASTQSLHVRHEISVHCTRPVWDNSQACLYNMAFEVNPKHVMENWNYKDIQADSVQSCVNVSYASAFENPKMFLPIDLRRISVRKTACVSRRTFREQIVISNIPFFGEALADVAASRDDTHPSALRVTAKFNVNTPWAFQLAETRLLEYIRGYLARYADLLVQTICS